MECSDLYLQEIKNTTYHSSGKHNKICDCQVRNHDSKDEICGKKGKNLKDNQKRKKWKKET
jgi:hypothetical protein